MARRSSPAVLLVATATALLSTACGGGGGDPPSEPAASVLGRGDRIRDIQGAADWLDPEDSDSVDCSVPADTTVNVTGVTVTAVDRFDEVADGALGNLYVQDTTKEPGEYEGMTVFDPAFTPPDLRVSRGDVLDLFGVYTEFLGPSSGFFGKCKTLPEVGGTGSFRFEGSKLPPKKVELQDIFGYENARRYLGMLITIENVTIAEAPTSSNPALPTGGRVTVALEHDGVDTTGVDTGDYPKISNELYDLLQEGPTLAKGAKVKSVTGVLTYFYGFKIAPRSAADFDLTAVQP